MSKGSSMSTDTWLTEVNPWPRLAFGLCATLAVVGTATASVRILWVLVGIATLAALSPVHPFDLIYNWGVRHRAGHEAPSETGYTEPVCMWHRCGVDPRNDLGVYGRAVCRGLRLRAWGSPDGGGAIGEHDRHLHPIHGLSVHLRCPRLTTNQLMPPAEQRILVTIHLRFSPMHPTHRPPSLRRGCPLRRGLAATVAKVDCSSLTYSQHARVSRLAGQAPRRLHVVDLF